MTDKQINKFLDLTFTQICGYDLVATFNNNRKIKELQEQLKRKEQECEELQNKFLELNGKAYSNSLEIDQLKQAIEKIKEMCSSVENIENANTLYESKLSGIYLQARKILQICDEVNE